MHPYIASLYRDTFLPKYLSQSLQIDKRLFSRNEVLDILGKERKSFSALASYIQQQKGLHFSEVLCSGTGSGALATTLSETLEIDRLIEIDINPDVIARRQLRNIDQTKRAAKVADVQSLPFEESTFSLSVAYAVLRYLSPLDKALDELYRTTQKGGTLLIGEGRKYQVIDQAEKYFQSCYPQVKTERIEIPDVTLPNLTFAYLLMTLFEEHKDPQLHATILQQTQERGLTPTEAIFELASSLQGSIFLLIVEK